MPDIFATAIVYAAFLIAVPGLFVLGVTWVLERIGERRGWDWSEIADRWVR